MWFKEFSLREKLTTGEISFSLFYWLPRRRTEEQGKLLRRLGAGDLGERIFSKGKGGAGVDFLPVLLYTSFAVANHSQLESGN